MEAQAVWLQPCRGTAAGHPHGLLVALGVLAHARPWQDRRGRQPSPTAHQGARAFESICCTTAPGERAPALLCHSSGPPRDHPREQQALVYLLTPHKAI